LYKLVFVLVVVIINKRNKSEFYYFYFKGYCRMQLEPTENKCVCIIVMNTSCFCISKMIYRLLLPANALFVAKHFEMELTFLYLHENRYLFSCNVCDVRKHQLLFKTGKRSNHLIYTNVIMVDWILQHVVVVCSVVL